MQRKQDPEISTKQIANLLNVTVRAINKRAKNEGWNGRPVNGNGKRVFKITELPSDIQKALAAKIDIPTELLPALAPEAALAAARRLAPDFLLNKEIATSVPSWTDDTLISQDALRNPRTARIVKIVQEAMDVPRGWKRRAWVEAVALKHDTTFQTVYLYINKYKKKGLAGLQHTKSTRKRPKAWTPEAVDFWIGLCLKKEHRKVAKDVLYGILATEARKRGWKVGGYRSALWWYEKKVSPQLLALQKGGSRALDNTLPPILRDYSDLQPFEILVGDQHRFDFWVLEEDSGEVFRPEAYFWQDLRTRSFYGGALDRKYDSYLMGLALRMGLKIFGPFDQIYTDHGKPEESRYIMGVMKDMRAVGLQIGRTVEASVDVTGLDPEEINPCMIMPGTHRYAIVRNAKAKMIEKTFDTLEGILRDHFLVPGYVKDLGGVKEENEVDQGELETLARAGKLLTFREFFLTVLKAMDYYNNRKSHRGLLKEWTWRPRPKTATPMDCLKACCMEGWRQVPLSEDAIDLIFLARAPRPRVVDRGRVMFRNEIYEHERLIEMHKAPVQIRFDPMDPDWILVFHQGEFVCRAEPVQYSSMKDRTLAQKKIEEKRRRRRGFILEYRRYTSEIPDVRKYSEVPAIERTAARIGKEKRDAQKALAEQFRTRTPEELEREVASIENYRPAPAADKPVFSSEVDRYEWSLSMMHQGRDLDEEDLAFVREFEQRMDQDTKTYWEIYRHSLTQEANRS